MAVSNDSASSIRTQLGTYLSAVTQLQDVANGRGIEFSGFPGCRYFLSAVEQVFLDNKPSDQRTFKFDIEIWQEITNKSKPNAESDFEDAVEAVLDTLHTNWHLGGHCDSMTVDAGPVSQRESLQGPCVVQTITVSVMTLIS